MNKAGSTKALAASLLSHWQLIENPSYCIQVVQAPYQILKHLLTSGSLLTPTKRSIEANGQGNQLVLLVEARDGQSTRPEGGNRATLADQVLSSPESDNIMSLSTSKAFCGRDLVCSSSVQSLQVKKPKSEKE